MNIKSLTAAILASLLMIGSVSAMDSAAVEERMQEISERSKQKAEETSRIVALEAQVKELEELVHMMLEEGES
ncbi:hypothetical protein SAMN05661010_01175 [Modicisalibacter muralis]|uniref:Uncharacterized protein n=1 Tax=Modicisalibacter muralis TaxID=119000 RepID=A0A1G9IFX7_9GAMM|nr:hypothetical protein [Halomonas muralis]SDL24012.1 hypothetical protein SAMN05661010_01175 [Halomonas muralis]